MATPQDFFIIDDPSVGELEYNTNLKLKRVYHLIYKALMERYAQSEDRLNYATVDKALAESQTRVDPAMIAKGVIVLGKGMSLIPSPGGAMQIAGAGLQEASYLTQAGFRKLSEYKSAKQQRQFLTKIERASRFCGLAIDREQMDLAASKVAHYLTFRYQGLITELKMGKGGTDALAAFLINAMHIDLANNLGPKDFSDKLISAAIPKLDSYQYRYKKLILARKKRLTIDKKSKDPAHGTNYTLFGGINEAGVMTVNGDFFVRPGYTPTFFGRRVNDRSDKYPLIYLAPDEDPSKQPLAYVYKETMQKNGGAKIRMRPPSPVKAVSRASSLGSQEEAEKLGVATSYNN